MFYINIRNDIKEYAFLSSGLTLWHERLAHISKDTVQKKVKNLIVDGMKKDNMNYDFICDGGLKGKFHQHT